MWRMKRIEREHEVVIQRAVPRLIRSTAAMVAIGLELVLPLIAQGPPSWPEELDAVRAAPDSHKVLFDNSMIRVLEVRVPPGTKEPFHHHRWPSIFINLDAGGSISAYRYYDEDGGVKHDRPQMNHPEKNIPEWRITWMEPEPLHAIENTETAESSRTPKWKPATLRVELKSRPLPDDIGAWPDELDAVRAAPDSHKVLFENAMIRVLEVSIPPGTKEPFHVHRWPSIFISLDGGGPVGASRFYDKDGRIKRDTPRIDQPTKNPPEWRIKWMKPEPLHAIENTETAESSRTLPHHSTTIRVEFKGAA